MFRKKNPSNLKEKVIDIGAGVEGNVKFSTPVNLRISGKFDGELETKGHLSIGENADVKAKVIKGEDILILGKVRGDIICAKRLEISPPASVAGDIQAPLLVVKEGAVLKGHCSVPPEEEKREIKKSSKKKK